MYWWALLNRFSLFFRPLVVIRVSCGQRFFLSQCWGAVFMWLSCYVDDWRRCCQNTQERRGECVGEKSARARKPSWCHYSLRLVKVGCATTGTQTALCSQVPIGSGRVLSDRLEISVAVQHPAALRNSNSQGKRPRFECVSTWASARFLLSPASLCWVRYLYVSPKSQEN